MTEKKSDMLKNILINLGVLLVLVGATAIKGDMAFFLYRTGPSGGPDL